MAEHLMDALMAEKIGAKQIVVYNLAPTGRDNRFIQLQYVPNGDGSWEEQRFDQDLKILDSITVNEPDGSDYNVNFDPIKFANANYEVVKVLWVEVFRSSLGDCTNGGISSVADSLELIMPERMYGFDSTTLKKMVETETRDIGGRTYKNVKPVVYPERRYMSGGNLIYTHDSRYESITGCPYPLCIHDRYETPEEYRMYSI